MCCIGDEVTEPRGVSGWDRCCGTTAGGHRGTETESRRGRREWKFGGGCAIAQWTLVLVGLGVLGWQVPARAHEADRLGPELAHLRWWWVGTAVLLNIGALAVYAELHRHLLAADRVRLPTRTIQAINFAENALSTTVPAVGNAAVFVYATYQLRKRNVDVALAAWSLVLAGTVATIMLMFVGLLGTGLAGQRRRIARRGIAVGSWACWHVVTRPSVLSRCLRTLAWPGRRLPRSAVRAAAPGTGRISFILIDPNSSSRYFRVICW